MSDTPDYFKDAKHLLTKDGFATGDTWYHGTSSALVGAIRKTGLKRSGDKAMKQLAKKTMATIGNSYTEAIEPVFLTQSKELAFYWALRCVQKRQSRFGEAESPVVFELSLPKSQSEKVRPDVGAASLLLTSEGEDFMAYLALVYQDCQAGVLDIDLMKADRMEYLDKLGMAYLNEDVKADCLTLLEA